MSKVHSAASVGLQRPRRPVKGLKTVWPLSANSVVVLIIKIGQAVPVLAHLGKSDLAGCTSPQAKLLREAGIYS